MKLVLAGLLAAAGAFAAAPAAAADCNVSHAEPWSAGGTAFTIEAFTHGATCATAVAVYTVRGPDGTLMHYQAFDSNFVLGLAGRTDAADMEAALKDWTSQQNASLASTADLPQWKADADAPDQGSFAFLPDEGFDREGYEQLRASRAPILCYAQGTESLACLALIEGQLQAVGLQLVPG